MTANNSDRATTSPTSPLSGAVGGPVGLAARIRRRYWVWALRRAVR